MNTVIKMAETRLYTCFALFAFVIGGIVGVSAIVIWMFAKIEHLGFDNVITLSLFGTFVLFGLGAHCLDVDERERRKNRE